MKKRLSMTLALAMLVTMFAGCTSEAPAPNASGSTSEPSGYPDKPIMAIVAFNPGGGTDIAARTILKHAEKYIGTNFVVENKPGAGGSIGWTAIATAKPDGYTIGMINPPSIVFNPITMGDKINYKLEDFRPIANFVSDPGAAVVLPDSQFQSLQDVVDYAKEHPEEVRIAYSGPGTSEALTIRRMEQQYDIKLRKIPFDGTGPMLTALMGDHVDMMFANVSEIMAQYKAESVRILAVGSEERIDMTPDVPTYKESGFDQVQIAMRGLAAPAGISDEMVAALADAMEKTFADPDFQKAAADLSLPLDYIGPDDYKALLEEFDAFYRDEFEKSPW